MVRFISLLLTLLTGFSALVYEVAWQKALATLLGSHSAATAAVLGIFLGGLSLGYWIFGGVTRRVVGRAERQGRRPRLLLVYGAVEAGIGLYALAFLTLFGAVRAVSGVIPAGSAGVSFAVDVGLTALLIGPPAVLMGGTIPMLTQALARSLADSTRIHARIYGINTVGAFAGALAAGFFLIPWLGIPAVLHGMGLLNLGVGAVFVSMGIWHRAVSAGGVRTAATAQAAAPAGAATQAAGAAGPARAQGFVVYAAVAVLLGFAMMAVQTVLIRVGGLAFGPSGFTFSMIVAVFVLCIALGSLWVSSAASIPRGALAVCAWSLVALLAALYPVLPDSTYYVYLLRTVFRDEAGAFYPYYLVGFLGVLAVLALPVGLSGAMLPLLFHRLRREVGELGNVAGRLYSWNTVGNLLGALLGGYALLFWIDLHHVYRLALAALVAGAVLVTLRAYRLRWLWGAPLLALPLAGLVLLPAWSPVRLSAGLFRTRNAPDNSYLTADAYFAARSPESVVFYDDGPTSSVAVQERVAGGRRDRSIVNNGKSDGSLWVDYNTTALLGLVPCLVADDCERAFVIGYGTGVTAGELAALESTREVVVSEISPAVIEAAPLFDYGNQEASQSPKVEIVRGDAYRSLLRSEGTYDVIVSEPSNPWVTGVEMLYSREFLTAARERLRPGGVYAQWFHTYETDDATVELVLRTYASVFDHVAVWYTLRRDLMLLGLQDPEGLQDLERIEERMVQPDFKAGLRRSGVETLPELLAHEVLPLGVAQEALEPGEVHTLFHPLLNHRAARAFFRGETGELPVSASLAAARVGAQSSLLRRYAERFGGTLPAEARDQALRELCTPGDGPENAGCAALVAYWTHEAPEDPERQELLERYRRNPALAEELAPELVSQLAAFYGSREDITEWPGYAQVDQATELFRSHYFHALPFHRSVLAAMWQRCRGEPCRAGAARAQLDLGNLRVRLLAAGADAANGEAPADVAAAPPEAAAEPTPAAAAADLPAHETAPSADGTAP